MQASRDLLWRSCRAKPQVVDKANHRVDCVAAARQIVRVRTGTN